MKFKRLLASAMAGILTLTGALTFTPTREEVANAEEENTNYYTKLIEEHVFAEGDSFDINNYSSIILFEGNYTSSDKIKFFPIDNNKLSILGAKGEYIQFTYTGNWNSSDQTFITFSNMVPKLDNSGSLARGNVQYKTNSNEYNKIITKRFLLSEFLDGATHTSTTGTKGESAADKVESIRATFSWMNSPVVKDIKIEVLTPKNAPTPKLDCTVKYQLRGSNPYDVRFIGEVDAEQIENAESATATVSKTVNDDPDHFTDVETTTITKAYKSVIANGQKQEAPEGKYFLISAVASDLTDGDKAKAVFSLNGASGESDRTVVIGNVPESSSEEESSSEPEESSSEAEDSSSDADSSETDSNVIWKGSESLGNWDTDVDLGVAGIPQAKKDGILTIEYTGTGAAQIQVINKIGEKWTWTPMLTADGNNYFDATGGKLQIKLTEQQAAELADSKAMFLKGKNATVTKITYVGPGENAGKTEVIWTGEEDLGSWNKDVDLEVAGIPLAEENGILTIEYTSAGAAQISVINKIGASWKWTPMKNAEGNEYFDTAGGKLQIKLTAEQAEQLATSKAMFLKGQNATVTKITYTTPGGNSGQTEVIWTGEADLGNWDKDVDLSVANIPLAEEGGILTIKYTASGAAQISVINKVGASWTWTPMKNAEGKEFFDTTGGKLEIKLTAEQAAQLVASKAMFLKGQNATVTEITYTTK